MSYPLQPIAQDEHGLMRFRENPIVRYLLDTHPYADMNHLAKVGLFSDEDREQFAMLIGYSLGGFSELPYVHHDTLVRAQRAARDAQEEVPF